MIRVRKDCSRGLVLALWCCLFGTSIGLLALRAAAQPKNAQKTAELMARVLAYDANLSKRVDSAVQVAVLFNPDRPRSVVARDALMDALAALGPDFRIKQLPIRAVPVAVIPGTPLTVATAAQPRLTALFVCRGLDDALVDITRYSRGHDVLSFTATEAHISAGVAVALLERDSKLRIVIHRRAAVAEGVALAPGLLALAELYRAEGGDGDRDLDADRPVRLKISMTPPTAIESTVIAPEYPSRLRAARVAGRVVLLLEVKRDGSVGEVKVRSGHPDLAVAAAAAVKRWRFNPAQHEGKPVAVWLPYPVVFKLEDERRGR